MAHTNSAIDSLNENKENLIKSATAKTTLVDADTIPLTDSAASSATKKITFANIKGALKTYFDTLYNPKIEIGTFTPVLYGGTTAGAFTYSLQEGTYVKIGSLVKLYIRIEISAITSVPSGALKIKGYPFPAISTPNGYARPFVITNSSAISSAYPATGFVYTGDILLRTASYSTFGIDGIAAGYIIHGCGDLYTSA